MIKSILVATDASPAANRALALAIEMTVKHEAKLEIVHVIRDLQIPANLRGMAEVMNMAGARGDVMMFVAEQVLNDARERASDGRGRGGRNVRRQGRPGRRYHCAGEAARERSHRARNPGTEQDGGGSARIGVAKGHEPVQDELPDRPLRTGERYSLRFPIGVDCRVRSLGVSGHGWRPCS